MVDRCLTGTKPVQGRGRELFWCNSAAWNPSCPGCVSLPSLSQSPFRSSLASIARSRMRTAFSSSTRGARYAQQARQVSSSRTRTDFGSSSSSTIITAPKKTQCRCFWPQWDLAGIKNKQLAHKSTCFLRVLLCCQDSCSDTHTQCCQQTNSCCCNTSVRDACGVLVVAGVVVTTTCAQLKNCCSAGSQAGV